MSGTGKIPLGQPENPLRSYTHLVPLVEDLVRRGNAMQVTGRRGELFVPIQGGMVAYLVQPLDIEYLRQAYDMSRLDHHGRDDMLVDPQN